jgi:hypothetical protein
MSIEKELKEIFNPKDKLSDKEVDQFMKIGEMIISLFRKDLDNATINYIDKIKKDRKCKHKKHCF